MAGRMSRVKENDANGTRLDAPGMLAREMFR